MANPNLKRNCFSNSKIRHHFINYFSYILFSVPLFDVISTHCRLLISNSNEKKIHLKLWQMLTNPNQLNDIEQNNSNKMFVL
jgi:hypothetical protein